MNKLIYLAGPIDGCTYTDCTDWREYAISRLVIEDITGLSPMRAKEYLRVHSTMKDGLSTNPISSDKGITVRDMWDCRRSDAILFNLLGAKKISVGTMIEYGWGSAFNKPIITVIEESGNVHEHQIVRGLTNFRVKTLEEGLQIVKALFAY